MNLIRHTITWGGLALLCTFASPAQGAGFQINEQSARSTGRGNAVIATTNDPSAIWHNPAGLANVKGTAFEAGVTLIAPGNGYEGPGLVSTNPSGDPVTGDLNSSPAFVPHVYGSYALSEMAVVGLGFYPSYGLGTEWEDGNRWVGRSQAEFTELRAFFFTPTVALKPVEWLNVAVGLQLVPATLVLEQTLGVTDGQDPSFGQILLPAADPSELDGRFKLAASAFGVGATAGIQVEATENLRLGFVYRSAVNLDFDGEVDFTLPSNVPSTTAANFPDGSGSGSVTVPHTFGLGVGWVEEHWTLEAATQLTLWDSFEELRINFDSGRPSAFTSEVREWNAVPMFRLGGEVRFGDFAGRAGVVYDLSPIPDETVEPGLPDGDRFNIAAGAGYTFGAFSVDLSYLAVILSSRDIPEEQAQPFNQVVEGQTAFSFPGRFTGGVQHLVAASLRVRI
ncbi:MAG: outer membrane protein transport protein [Myxococcota bacterium]